MASIQSKKTLTCPKCGNRQECIHWESIDVTQEPQLREQVLNHSLFTFKCRKCGDSMILGYPCLYHDGVRKQLFYLIPNYKEADVKQFERMPAKPDADEGYTLRIVGSLNQLVEKIRIFDAGKDDRYVELCKLYGAKLIQKERPNVKIAEIYFDDDAEDAYIVFCENGSRFKVQFTGLYAKVEQDFQKRIKYQDATSPNRYEAIDAVWAFALSQKKK